jgi:hypothetical protein
MGPFTAALRFAAFACVAGAWILKGEGGLPCALAAFALAVASLERRRLIGRIEDGTGETPPIEGRKLALTLRLLGLAAAVTALFQGEHALRFFLPALLLTVVATERENGFLRRRLEQEAPAPPPVEDPSPPARTRQARAA